MVILLIAWLSKQILNNLLFFETNKANIVQRLKLCLIKFLAKCYQLFAAICHVPFDSFCNEEDVICWILESNLFYGRFAALKVTSLATLQVKCGNILIIKIIVKEGCDSASYWSSY